MITIEATQEVLTESLTAKEAQNLVAGDKVFVFDPVTELQALASVVSVLPATASCRMINGVALAPSTGIVVYRNEAYKLVRGFYSHDLVPFIPFDDSLRAVDVISSVDAYTYGATGTTLWGNWSKANLFAYLAALFDSYGGLTVNSTGIKRLEFDALPTAIESDVEALCIALVGDIFMFPILSRHEAVNLYAGIEPYSQNFSYTAEASVDIMYRVFEKASATKTLVEVELDTDGCILLGDGLAIGAV